MFECAITWPSIAHEECAVRQSFSNPPVTLCCGLCCPVCIHGLEGVCTPSGNVVVGVQPAVAQVPLRRVHSYRVPSCRPVHASHCACELDERTAKNNKKDFSLMFTTIGKNGSLPNLWLRLRRPLPLCPPSPHCEERLDRRQNRPSTGGTPFRTFHGTLKTVHTSSLFSGHLRKL